MLLLLALYKFTIFFWDSESFIFFSLSFYTHWQKIFLTPPTRETPQKMLFYSAAIQHSFNGGALVVAAALLLYFSRPPRTAQSELSSQCWERAGRRKKKHPTHTAPCSRGKFFENVFFGEKMYTTLIPPPPFAARFALVREEKYKIPLKI